MFTIRFGKCSSIVAERVQRPCAGLEQMFHSAEPLPRFGSLQDRIVSFSPSREGEPGLEIEINTVSEESDGVARVTRAEPQCIGIRRVFRLIAVGLAVAQIILGRNTFGPDPRSYMELARAILKHDWAMVVNAYWSALYPWLLAAALALFRPSLRWEFPVAHALSLPMYLACMAAFEFFWATLLRRRQTDAATRDFNATPILPAQMWILGYSFFVWATIGDLVLLVNPDLLVAACVLLSAGLLMRIEMEERSVHGLYIWLGLCLGVGYLTKAILFPMAFVFLGAMIYVSRRHMRKRYGYMALALLVFAGIATPQIALLSHAKGRLTFSDTGKLNLAWFNYHLPYRNWQGLPAGTGLPAHSTRQIFDRPAAYEFDGPLRASYPPWFDPSYWNEGMAPEFSFTAGVKHFCHEITVLGSLFVHPTAWIVGVLLILFGSRPRDTLSGIATYGYLIVLAAVAVSFYCLTNIQGRFFVPWELLIWGAVLAGVRLRTASLMWSRGLVALMSFVMMAAMAHLVYGESLQRFPSDATPEYETAEGLQRVGLQKGERVAAIGFDNDIHWAYLDRFSVVGEIDTDDTCLFWSEPAAIQSTILEKFANAGAHAVVANTGGGVRTTSRAEPIDLAGCSRPGAGWLPIPGSPNHVFFLPDVRLKKNGEK